MFDQHLYPQTQQKAFNEDLRLRLPQGHSSDPQVLEVGEPAVSADSTRILNASTSMSLGHIVVSCWLRRSGSSGGGRNMSNSRSENRGSRGRWPGGGGGGSSSCISSY